MQRSHPVPPQAPAAPGQVPSTQALLQTALAASWQRDRRVGLRRLAWRWLIWGLWRCAALVLLLTVLWAAWHGLVPETPTPQWGSAPDKPTTPNASLARSAVPASREARGTTVFLQDPSPEPDPPSYSKEP